MYPLFQLVRLFSIKDDINLPNVKITCRAWRQHGESSLLALVSSNGFIVLRYSTSGKSPVVKQLPWPPDHPIIALCFDPTVAWLLVLTDNGNLFIIPALAILDREAQVNRLWRLDDVTIITTVKPRGNPTFVLWWNTLDGQQIAVMATKLGELIFVNLLTQKVITEAYVDAAIKNLEVITDDQQMTTHLLITGSSGTQWKMLLESRVMSISPPDTELSDLGYEKIDGLHLPVSSVLASAAESMKDMFKPLRFYQFQRSVSLSPQYAKGRHFVAAHCDKTSTYQVYDSNVEHNPLFVYKVPFGSMKIIFTDRVMFAASKLSSDQKLIILSNQRAESSDDEYKDFNRDAILQQIELPDDEKLLAVVKKSFPFYWHEKIEADEISKLISDKEELDQTDSNQSKMSALEIQLTSHTVLDGCIIITDTTVYECRPRISPERLFLELCINQSDTAFAEQLGISLSLDLNSLFGVAADFLLSHGNSSQAARLFHVSKAPAVRRVASFSKYGFIQEVMPFLQQILSKDSGEISAEERKQLSDMALHGLVYQMKQEATDRSGLLETFRNFLFNNFDFTVQEALPLLARSGMEEILFEFAMSRGLVIDALSALASEGYYKINSASLEQLVLKGFSAHVAQAAGGAFLQCLDAHGLVKIFCDKPQLVSQHPELLLCNLNDLDLGSLLQLAECLDPSQPLVHGFLQRKIQARKRTSSMNSLYGGEMADTNSGDAPDAVALLHCFLMVVLTLNKKRKDYGDPVNMEYLYTSPAAFLKTVVESSPPPKQKLALKPMPVGCGQSHSALIMKGDLYTWGKGTMGRLGHGEDRSDEAVLQPYKVETFSMLQIKVMSVVCGGEHTIVITQQGVYGWGSSKHGQVGLNTRHVYTRPMQIEALSKVPCVAVSCGQYHTLALTDEAHVYSWGWGIHGQLGHGDPEDRLVPTLVTSLSDGSICRVQGGFCHSLAQTLQGDLYAFGCGFFGQLGQGTTQKQSLPVKVTKLPEKIRTCSTKFFHSAVVTKSNRVYQWGAHPQGLRYHIHAQRRASRHNSQPSTDQVDSHLVPQLIDTSYVRGRIKQVICGSLHTCLITRDGDVYSWGRNLDGQIGNGTRQDLRIPQMITHINHKQISHLASGGEFNIAMDTENHVWVWGRNEFGQLGLQTSDVKGSNKVIRVSGSKNIGNQVTEVTVPTALHVEPLSPQSSVALGTGSLMESFTRSVSLESMDTNISFTEEEEEQLSFLPSLGTIGDVQYGRLIIPIVLQSLWKICNCQQLLRTCADMEDWCSAASINIHLQNYTQALSFHLRALRNSRQTDNSDHDINDTQRFSTDSIQAFQYYYRLMLDKRMSPSHEEENLRLMLTEVLQHWEREQLLVAKLEEFLTTTLDNTATVLALILFRKPLSNTSAESKEVDCPSENFMAVSSEFQKYFSTKFCLSVLSRVLQKTQNTEVIEESSLSELKQLGGEVFQKFPVSMCEGDKLPYDQLWQDIVQNLTKGLNSKKYIYITHSELDRLDEQFQQTEQLSSAGEGHRSSAVFFTCGHYFTKSVFLRELSILNKELISDKMKLPETAAVLQEYYNRKTALPMACPRCVSTAIPTLV